MSITKRAICMFITVAMSFSLLVGILPPIKTMAILDTPMITSPVESGLYSDSESISFKWKAVSGASYYLYAVKDLTTGESLKNNVKTTSRSVTLSSSLLEAGHTIKFAVGAYNDNGEASEWDDVQIKILLSEAEITSPDPDDTYTAGEKLYLKWNKVSGATYYRITVRDVTEGENSDPNKVIYSNDKYTSTSRSIGIDGSKFKAGHTYKFAVGAYRQHRTCRLGNSVY